MTLIETRKTTLRCGAALIIAGFASTAHAQQHSFNIPSEDAATAIVEFGRQAGVQIIAPVSQLQGVKTKPVFGNLDAHAALAQLLIGTGLSVASDNGRVIALHRTPKSPEPPAANNEAAQSIVMQEVVVTAQKRSERLKDVPLSVSVISGEQLIGQQATTLQDIVDKVPGLQLVSGSPITNELVIRGISIGSNINSSVATYVDEVPYTSQGPFAFSSHISPNFDTYDLARVEVLRGPQGTLYGASALSGLLKYVTNAPDPTRYSASVLAGASSVDHGGAGGEIHAMVNLPLGDKAALRVVADSSYFPGFIDDPARDVKDENGINRYGVRASLLWRPVDDFSIRLTAAYQRLKARDFNTEDLDATTLKPLYGDLTQERFFGQPETESNQIYNVTANWDFHFANLVSSTSYSKVNPVLALDESSDIGNYLSTTYGGNYGLEMTSAEPVHSFVQELRLSSPKNDRLEWLIGGYYNAEGATEYEPYVAYDLNAGKPNYNFQPALGAYNIKASYREYAGFGDVTYHFTKAFEIGFGGRYSTNSQTYHQQDDGIFTGTDDFGSASRQSVFTYSVDTKYRFNREMMIYGRVATGFVPGGPNDVIPGSPLPSSFKSSSTTNYEVGLKGDLYRGRITYDVDAFDIEWDDIQLLAEVNNLYAITNGGSARSQGLEGAASYKPFRGLTLSASGAYTDARLTAALPASFGGLAGDRLPLSPYFASTVGASFERPLWGDVAGFAGIDWHYDGDRMSQFEYGASRQKLPSYSIVNLRAGVNFKQYTLTVYMKNATDARALNSVSPETLGGISAVSASVDTPRTIGMTVAAKF